MWGTPAPAQAERGSPKDVLTREPVNMSPYKAKGTIDVIKIKHCEMDRLSRTRLLACELLESLHVEKLSPLWLEGAVTRPRQRPGCEGGGWGREPMGVGVPKAGRGPVVALLGGRQEEPALRPLSDPSHCVRLRVCGTQRPPVWVVLSHRVWGNWLEQH